MNYEEKYNEILEWARKNKARLNGVPIEEVLPELAESEDERIRKEIISAILSGRVYDTDLIGAGHIFQLDKEVADKWIAYLEKQKEQKPAEWNEEDEKKLARVIWYVEKGCSMIFQKSDELVFWLKSLPERFNLQPKQEWSEEDERMRNALWNLLHLHYAQDNAQSLVGIEAGKFRSWLKSLKPSWKPSEVCYGPKGDPDPAGVWKPSEGQQGVEPLTKLEKAVFDMLVERTNEITISEKQARKYAPIFLAIVKDEILGEHWKPSEEQMKAMGYFVRKHQATANRATTKWPEFEAFKSLYNDLKKRM